MSSRLAVLVAPAYYAALAVLVMGRAALHPGRYKFGTDKTGDSLQGIYDYWLYGGAGRAHWRDGTNPLLGAPLGEPLSSLSTLHHWLGSALATALPPVAAYNLVILAALALAGWLAHRLFLELGSDRGAAFVLGTAFATTPYTLVHAAHHPGLAHVWVFPLLLLALLRYAVRPEGRRALALAAATALPIWVHGYYGAFAPLLVALLLPGLLLRHWRSGALRPGSLCAQAGCAALAAGVSSAVYLSVSEVVQASSGDLQVAPTLRRGLWDLERFGIRAYEFLLPPYYSNFAAAPVQAFLDRHDHGSEPAETTLYLGAVPMLIVVAAGLAALKSRLGRRAAAAEPNPAVPRVHWAVIAVWIAVPALMGAPPRLELGELSVSTPSAWLYSAVPMLRALSRWGIVSILGFACLAAIALARWRARARGRWSAAVPAALIALVLVDQVPARRFSLDTTRVPPWYEAVRRLPGDPVILDLPRWDDVNARPLFWQMHHGKRLFNSKRTDHVHFATRRSVYNQAMRRGRVKTILAEARRDGIDYVLVRGMREVPAFAEISQSFEAESVGDGVLNWHHAILIEVP